MVAPLPPPLVAAKIAAAARTPSPTYKGIFELVSCAPSTPATVPDAKGATSSAKAAVTNSRGAKKLAPTIFLKGIARSFAMKKVRPPPGAEPDLGGSGEYLFVSASVLLIPGSATRVNRSVAFYGPAMASRRAFWHFLQGREEAGCDRSSFQLAGSSPTNQRYRSLRSRRRVFPYHSRRFNVAVILRIIGFVY
jgi:hypothetical protein